MDWLRSHLDDLLVVSGCGLICYGTYVICPVATWFVGGAMLIALGVLVGLGAGGGK